MTPVSSFHRYVALGDSFAEGVGDPDPVAPNGLRGWADRVAAVLAAGRPPDFRYANLAIRGRKLDAVLAEQIEPAVALGPDLVTIYAGGNDILRPKVDIDAPGRAVRRRAGQAGRHRRPAGGVHRLRPRRFRRSTGRCAAGSRSTTSWCAPVADRHGATIVDFWRMRELPRLALLGPRPDAPGPGRPPADGDAGARRARRPPRRSTSPSCRRRWCSDRAEPRRANREWARSHLGPWVTAASDRPLQRRPRHPEATGPLPARVTARPAERFQGASAGCTMGAPCRPSAGC